MRLFGFEITRTKDLARINHRGGWGSLAIRESYTGAWQQNAPEVSLSSVLTYPTVFRCIGLISTDIAKLRVRLMQDRRDGTSMPVDNPAFSPVLRKPNHYQTRFQFFESWVESKLVHGNSYILKEYDERQVVSAMYVLNPEAVTPLVSDSGEIWYRLSRDNLSGIGEDYTVPARMIIHDRWNTINHPLVGHSPIYACGLAAVQGLNIQTNATNFFGNASQPGGLLLAPGAISEESINQLKTYWDANFTGSNTGKIAILGDDLKYQSMTMKATDAQMLETLQWSSQTICSVFGVPPHKVSVGDNPTVNNIEALDAQYYAQCLQGLIEAIEALLVDGLRMKRGLSVQFNLDDLLRMDTKTLIDAEAEAVKSGIKAPNESRKRLNLPPVRGGETPYLQQQNFSLEALSRRDVNPAPSGVSGPSASPQLPPAEPADEPDTEQQRAISARLRKALSAA